MIDFIVEFKTNCGYYWGKVYQNKLPILYQFILPLTLVRNISRFLYIITCWMLSS
jgi:hypothetical protein